MLIDYIYELYPPDMADVMLSILDRYDDDGINDLSSIAETEDHTTLKNLIDSTVTLRLTNSLKEFGIRLHESHDMPITSMNRLLFILENIKTLESDLISTVKGFTPYEGLMHYLEESSGYDTSYLIDNMDSVDSSLIDLLTGKSEQDDNLSYSHPNAVMIESFIKEHSPSIAALFSSYSKDSRFKVDLPSMLAYIDTSPYKDEFIKDATINIALLILISDGAIDISKISLIVSKLGIDVDENEINNLLKEVGYEV